MTKFKKTLLAGVASTALGLTLAAPAQADLFAYSKLLLENFQILGSDGQILDYNTDFGVLNYTSSADQVGSLTGTPGFNFSAPNGQNTDFPASCVSTTGDCNPLLPENSFPFMTGPQGADYVAADQQETGAPIANLPGFVQGATIGGIAAGSLSATEAEGTANVNNGLEASWTFTLTQNTGITFAGSVSTYLEAFASAGEIFPGKASATTTFEITITDLSGGTGVVFALSPDLLNETTSANAGGFPVDIQTCGTLANALGSCGIELATAFNETTGVLTAGTLYQLSARINTNVDIARVDVPEPGILALLGLGFLGMFVAGGRRRRA